MKMIFYSNVDKTHFHKAKLENYSEITEMAYKMRV